LAPLAVALPVSAAAAFKASARAATKARRGGDAEPAAGTARRFIVVLLALVVIDLSLSSARRAQRRSISLAAARACHS
jgi:hypothetical protein